MTPDLATDQWGLGVTTTGPGAVAALDETLMSYLAIGRKTGGLLMLTIKADPGLVMGHSLKGYLDRKSVV